MTARAYFLNGLRGWITNLERRQIEIEVRGKRLAQQGHPDAASHVELARINKALLEILWAELTVAVLGAPLPPPEERAAPIDDLGPGWRAPR